MSELTLCNHCKLQDIQRRAEERGATVTVTHLTHQDAGQRGDPGLVGWYEVQESDRDRPSSWFLELTVGCAC